MAVTEMARFRSKETRAVLQHLLDREERGELQGVALCVRLLNGAEEIVFTDLYRRDIDKAVAAATRIWRRLTQLQDAPE